MFTLPLLDWCPVSAGEVTITYRSYLGIINHAVQYDVVEKVFHVEAFHISKYPVTNGQYRVFIDDPDGYAQAKWWGFMPAAKEWRIQHPQPQPALAEIEYATNPPKEFVSKRLPPPLPDNVDEHPRELVNWYDAMAFCHWLSSKTQLPITLPTERSGSGQPKAMI